MEFKGTQGDWLLKHSETKDAYNVIGSKIGNRYKIARCPYIKLSFTSKDELEAKHNALLISKAPQMILELKETITDLNILKFQIMDAVKTNHLFEGMPELIEKWIERKKDLIKEATEL